MYCDSSRDAVGVSVYGCARAVETSARLQVVGLPEVCGGSVVVCKLHIRWSNRDARDRWSKVAVGSWRRSEARSGPNYVRAVVVVSE